MEFRYSPHQEISSKELAGLIESRGLNNAKLAKILGVEGWTVGAWLNGKREISDKYKARIFELLKLPKNSDLLVAPAANHLSFRLGQVDDLNDRPHVIDALVTVNTAAARTLLSFSPSNIDPSELGAFEDLWKAYDDHSLAQLLGLITTILAERIRVAALGPQEFAQECQRRASRSGDISLHPSDTFLSVDLAPGIDEEEQLHELSRDLQSDFASKRFDPEMGLGDIFHPDTGECLLTSDEREEALQEIRDRHEDSIKEEAKRLFQNSGFREDKGNHQWLDKNQFMVSYTIDFNHPKFKESLRLVMDRQGIK
ncbi:MAG: hypothetical protein ACXWP5_00665 [Bdellovibrionota bacterium]